MAAPVLGAFDDPHLPPGKVDWVLIVDAYHTFSEPRAGQRDFHHVPAADLIAEWTAGGFELEYRAEYVPRFSTL